MTAPSPFHRGEQEIQRRLGVREQAEGLGQRFIRDHMPEEHRDFYEELPYLMLGTVDATGRPWASILVGDPGFMRAPDARTLRINARPLAHDPAAENLAVGAQAGLLGILFNQRRRNRMNGAVTAVHDDGFTISVSQSFGNCPMYIQARDHQPLDAGVSATAPEVATFDRFDDSMRRLISTSDSFFIASQFSEGEGHASDGVDVSHRGGKPGFVRVDDERHLTFPDFSGNRHFNTLGNILLEPRVGLLFIDFESRDLVYLTGSAEIIWEGEELEAFTGAERLVRFRLDEGRYVAGGLPMRFTFRDYSPVLEQGGSWEEVAATLASRRQGNVLDEYRVQRVVEESETIRSFHLVPVHGAKPPCHRPGQFLPLELHPPGATAALRRTYTISNAPDGQQLRVTIKRELAPTEDVPAGVASNYFHDHVREGTMLTALRPRGCFHLDVESPRSVVLLSAGVGITPMIAMLEHLVAGEGSCSGARKVCFVHGARSGAEHAFGPHVRELASRCESVNAHVVYSRPRTEDVLGRDHDSVGHVDVELLRSLLPFDDYDFYLCGPTSWTEALHDGLRGLNVAADRIRYEFFGPASRLGAGDTVIPEDAPSQPVPVRFERSGIDVEWDASKGTLLELAEAHGLSPVYSCRSGICQSCSTKVCAGDVSYVDPPMTPPAEGEALICCAFPGATDDETLTLDL